MRIVSVLKLVSNQIVFHYCIVCIVGPVPNQIVVFILRWTQL
jgi:hypothetical protein